MDASGNKQAIVSILKPAAKKMRLRYKVIASLVVILIIAVGGFLIFKKDATKSQTPSQQLASTVSDLESGSNCTNGLKQLNSSASKLAKPSSQYSDSAREAALKYLMSCEFQAGNSKQGHLYATQLNAVYSREHNLKGAQELQTYLYYEDNPGFH